MRLRQIPTGLTAIFVTAAALAGAPSLDPGELQRAADAALSPAAPPVCATCAPQEQQPSPIPASAPSCLELSDRWCERLWQKPRNGTIEREGESIRLGTSGPSTLSDVERISLRALADARTRLSPTLRAEIGGALEDLAQHLQIEDATPAWRHKARDFPVELSRKVRALVVSQMRAEQRTAARTALQHAARAKSAPAQEDDEDEESPLSRAPIPKDLGPDSANWPPQERVRLEERFQDLKNEITRAQWEEHPAWKRRQKKFEEVRADMLQLIAESPLTAEDKKRISSRIRTAELTLPYSDPRILPGRVEDCEYNALNAQYFPETHRLTVCVGSLVGVETDAGAYALLGHEVAHTFSPRTLARTIFYQTEIGAMTARLPKTAPQSGLACAEWEEHKKLLRQKPSLREPDPYGGLQSLAACLAPGKATAPWDFSKLSSWAFSETGATFDQFATESRFGLLIPRTYREDGESRSNPYALRPDLVIADKQEDWQNLILPANLSHFYELYYFRQEWLCSSGPDAQRFERALSNAHELSVKRLVHETATSCGRECSWLPRDEGFSRNADEAIADWFSHQLLARRLAREAFVERRRDLAFDALATFCPKPDPLSASPELNEIEKQYSSEGHDPDRSRRSAMLTPEVGALLGCHSEIPRLRSCQLDTPQATPPTTKTKRDKR